MPIIASDKILSEIATYDYLCNKIPLLIAIPDTPNQVVLVLGGVPKNRKKIDTETDTETQGCAKFDSDTRHFESRCGTDSDNITDPCSKPNPNKNPNVKPNGKTWRFSSSEPLSKLTKKFNIQSNIILRNPLKLCPTPFGQDVALTMIKPFRTPNLSLLVFVFVGVQNDFAIKRTLCEIFGARQIYRPHSNLTY